MPGLIKTIFNLSLEYKGLVSFYFYCQTYLWFLLFSNPINLNFNVKQILYLSPQLYLAVMTWLLNVFTEFSPFFLNIFKISSNSIKNELVTKCKTLLFSQIYFSVGQFCSLPSFFFFNWLSLKSEVNTREFILDRGETDIDMLMLHGFLNLHSWILWNICFSERVQYVLRFAPHSVDFTS